MSVDGQEVTPLVTEEMRRKIAELRKTQRRMIAELKVDVTGLLEGTIDSWPAKIQDRIYEALEARSKQSDIKYTIKMSYCDIEPETKIPFIHVIATGQVTQQ